MNSIIYRSHQGNSVRSLKISVRPRRRVNATGQFGKNYHGDLDKHLPTLHGFEEFFGGYLYHLEDIGETDNTIVVFTTDNGAETFNWPDGGNRRRSKARREHPAKAVPRAVFRALAGPH